jgi:hypothetical protein
MGVTYIMGFKTWVLRYSIIALLLVMITIGNASATGSVYILPEMTTELSPGDTFTLTVNVDSQEDYLIGIESTLNYDPNTFKVVKLTEEGILGENILILPGSGDDGQGTIKYGIATSDDYGYKADDSKFLTLEFQVLDNTEDGIFYLNFGGIRLIDKNSNALSGKAVGSVILIGDVLIEDAQEPTSIDIGPTVKSVKSTTSPSMTSTTTSLSSQPQIEYEYIFGSHPDSYRVIEKRGIIEDPENNNGKIITLQNKLKTNFDNDQFYPRGKIMSMGTNSAGYMFVIFYEPLIEQGDADNIYSIIEGEAKAMGIDNVPVEFGSGTNSQIGNALQDLSSNVKAMNELSLAAFTDEMNSFYDSSIIDTIGVLPKIETEKECWQWFFQDSYRISQDSGAKLESYIQSGKIVSMGVSPNGYFEVRINEEADIDRESVINEIYQILNDEGKKNGVNEVPVVFRLITPTDEDAPDSLQEEVIEESMELESEALKTPGFCFITAIVALSMVYCIRKRSMQHN